MNVCTVYHLTVLSFVLGAVSVVLFALAVSTDFWLTTREAIEHDTSTNDTIMWIRVWTGLWRFCIMPESAPQFINCMAVSYEVQETGRNEGHGTTSTTIIAAARRSVALPVSALILAVLAVIFSVVGNIRNDAKTLIGAVFFILSGVSANGRMFDMPDLDSPGLSLAVGMILYISAINDEVGYRVSNSKKDGGFSYAYGWSFFTAGFGFLASEVAAVVTITLFLRRNAKPEDMARIIPGLEGKMGGDPEPVLEHYCGGAKREDRRQLCRSGRRNASRCFHLCRGAHSLSVSA